LAGYFYASRDWLLLADFSTTGFSTGSEAFYYMRDVFFYCTGVLDSETGDLTSSVGDLLSSTGDFLYLTGDFKVLSFLKLLTIFSSANLDFSR
jgi:hypothetical protein